MSKNLLISNLFRVKDLSDIEIKRLSKIFSNKIGIINAILRRGELEKYELSMFQCLSAQTRVLFDLDREVSSGGLGVDFSPRKAFLACIGEAIERYCMSYSDKKDLKYCFLRDLPKKYKQENFYLYSDRQYRENRSFNNPKVAKIFWVELENFQNPSKKIFWPASLIYLPFKYGKLVAETSSTGVGADTVINRAILHGLLEIIERDALMINFLQRLNPPQIKLDALGKRNRILVNKIKKVYELKIYKLYSDIKIPIYLGFIWRGEKAGLHYGIGAAADINSENAINKTLKECLFTYFYSRNLMHLKPKAKNEIKTLYEHFLYYQGNNFLKLLFDKSKKQIYKIEKFSVEYLLHELKRNEVEVYFKELTTPDIIITRFKVVRVVVPGFIDINKTYNLRREAAVRFWDVPKKLGLVSKKILWKEPHPFP